MTAPLVWETLDSDRMVADTAAGRFEVIRYNAFGCFFLRFQRRDTGGRLRTRRMVASGFARAAEACQWAQEIERGERPMLLASPPRQQARRKAAAA